MIIKFNYINSKGNAEGAFICLSTFPLTLLINIRLLFNVA